MDKKVLKFYEAPVVEAMEMLTEGFLCASTGGNAEGIGEEDLTVDPGDLD